ncbi:MAG: hypothetical protein D6721_10510 [Gammaproteobacteria bacterium]|nr:MAG: hypothetical protein D6721_10510 [Gammaproteobacteria bacterium]
MCSRLEPRALPSVPRGPGHRLFALLWLLAGGLGAGGAAAITQLHLDTPALAGPGLRIEDLHARVTFAPEGLALVVEAGRLEVPGGALTRLRLTCPRLVQRAHRLACRRGRLDFTDPGLGTRAYTWAGSYVLATGALRLRLQGRGDPFRRLEVWFTGGGAPGGRLRVRGLSLAALAALLRHHGLVLPPLEPRGTATAVVRFRRRGAHWSWEGDLDVRELAFSNPDGTLAAESVRLRARVSGRGLPGPGMRGRLRLEGTQGALYIDPLYLERRPGAPPLELEAAFRRTRHGWVFERVHYRHPGVLALALDRLSLPPQPHAAFTLTLLDAHLDRAWPAYVQPWLAGSLADDLDLAGTAQGTLRLRGRTLEAVRLQVRGGRVDDHLGRLRLDGVEIDLEHARDGQVHHSRVRWRNGRLYRVTLGATDLALRSQGTRWSLEKEASLPVLDGRLLVDTFDLRLPSGKGAAPEWHLDAVLTPVSLRRLAAALHWPPFRGTLSGVIPDVHYAHHRLRVGGVLLAQVFDGAVRVRHLVLERPFGRFPRLHADVELDRLDLEPLTGAFSFGRIEGRLSGYVRDLVLEDWQPVAFDAWLGTPADDRGPHRISQRAVENLSSLGGGATGALSKGLLRFFENFPYRRLGIGCRLAEGVCRMRGVAPAPRGYYIVQGRLLPHLDVVGYATELDWNTLVARLKAATRGGKARIR